MGALTKNERDGLEDVFLSIHSNHDKYQKIKKLSSLILTKSINFSAHKLLKQANLGLKESKLSNFLSKFAKKKKNLSK